MPEETAEEIDIWEAGDTARGGEPTFSYFETDDGRKVATPTSVEEVASLLEEATRKRLKVKPVGWSRSYRGHSWSRVNRPEEFTLALNGMSGRERRAGFGLDPETVKSDVDLSRLYPVQGGTEVEVLCGALRSSGRALANMAAYTGQTIAGAVATDSHGTGLGHGPMSTLVRALVLVTTSGEILRLEPDDGMSEPEAFRRAHPNIELHQDDDLFYAAVVGLGCMGVVTSLVVETVPDYYLEETREVTTWEELKPKLRAGAPRECRHYSFSVNPYRIDGRHRCLVVRRTLVDGRPDDLTHKQKNRSFTYRLAAAFGAVGDVVSRRMLNKPERRGDMIDRALGMVEDESYISHWNNVLVQGLDRWEYASTEFGIPFDDAGDYVDVIDGYIDQVNPATDSGPDDFRPTGPIGVRFEGASDAWLSPQYRRPSCTMEVLTHREATTDPSENVQSAFQTLNRYLIERGGRPHWAKHNTFGWGDIVDNYPEEAYGRWLDAYARFNSAGIFNSDFTDRLGISQ